MYRENKLKKSLAAGHKAFGIWTNLDSALSTEVVAMAGFDFLLIDQEHGFGDPKQLAHQLQAMSATETTSIVRVPSQDPDYTKRILDAGAEAIMFPKVDTAEEAQALVKSCLYAPDGKRGLAPGIIRASNYGYNAGEYLATANENLMIICQIETVEAVDNLEEIVAVEGIDMFFVGPNDLSASNGKIGNFEDPDFVAMMLKIEQVVFDSGKYLATIPYGAYSWQDLFDKGYHLATAATDITLLRTGCAALVQQYKEKNKK